jgi:hypothetical protein
LAAATPSTTTVRIGRLAKRIDFPLYEVPIEFAVGVIAA